MIYDLEWENYIGTLFSKIVKNYYYVPQIAVEILPSFKVKGAITLKNLDFTGTLYVIDENKKVCKFIEEEYKKFIPKAKIITICKNLKYCLGDIPANIDLLIGNHCIDDIILSNYMIKKGSRMYPDNKRALENKWEDIKENTLLCKNACDDAYEIFYNIFKTKNINYVILSQYKSNVFLTNSFAHDVSKEVFNKIKLFVKEEDSNYFLKNIHPFKKDERYLLPSLLSNVQDSTNWIIGKPVKEIETIFNIMKDPYYSVLFERTKNIKLCFESGFINTPPVKYNDNILTTPLNKIHIDDTVTNPVVLLSTGGFNPIHNGHILMLKKAKNMLENYGYDVIGAFLSPSHESYVSTKENYIDNQFDRLNYNYKILQNYDWINIDTWESLCNDRYINFTIVIDRLEKYLRRFVRSDIKVAYVCGDDNIYFMNVFKEKGLGICVERNNPRFDMISRQIFSPNIFYIKDAVITDSSRNMRKIPQKIDFNGTYIIRDEGILPFKNINVPEKEKIKAQEFFKKNFLKIIKKYIPLEVKLVSVEEEIKNAKKKLKNVNTLSIDTFFAGKYNLDISRQFYFSDAQITNTKLVESPFSKNLEMQIKDLPNETFTLVDDDSVSGKTISLLKEKIKLDNIFLLSSIYKGDIFDVIDLRDFIFGTYKSGLVVDFFNKNIRVPYIYPYVNLYTRANIIDAKSFTREIINLNIAMYKNFFPSLTTDSLDSSFVMLCEKQGFKTDVPAYMTIQNFLI